MRFFKHFVDGHESYSMTELIRQLGIEGYGAYFILMELAVAKIDKKKDEEFSEEHCRFRIHGHVLRQKLAMRTPKLLKFLEACQALSLLEFNSSSTQVEVEFNSSSTQVQLPSTQVEDEFNFYIPKILESLDRDAKRARTERGPPALKKKNKKEIKNKNIGAHEIEMEKAFERFPIKVKGQLALKRFVDQVIAKNRQADFEKAMTNYLAMLSLEAWRVPKQSWETFLGAEQFWTAFIEWTAPLKRDPKAISRAPIRAVPNDPVQMDQTSRPPEIIEPELSIEDREAELASIERQLASHPHAPFRPLLESRRNILRATLGKKDVS